MDDEDWWRSIDHDLFGDLDLIVAAGTVPSVVFVHHVCFSQPHKTLVESACHWYIHHSEWTEGDLLASTGLTDD